MITVLDPYETTRGLVLTALGALDVEGAPVLRDTTRALLADGGVRLLLDLRGVTALDATGAGTLLGLHHRAALSGGALYVALEAPELLALLGRCGLAHRLQLLTSGAEVTAWCAPVEADRPAALL
jgi:anti-anti-sigma factor